MIQAGNRMFESGEQATGNVALADMRECDDGHKTPIPEYKYRMDRVSHSESHDDPFEASAPSSTGLSTHRS
jgi:hypothetical protein